MRTCHAQRAVHHIVSLGAISAMKVSIVLLDRPAKAHTVEINLLNTVGSIRLSRCDNKMILLTYTAHKLW
jgi:hypothetical protein